MDRCVQLLIDIIDIKIVHVEQVRDDRSLVALCSELKRRDACHVLCANIAPFCNQLFQELQISIERCIVNGCHPLLLSIAKIDPVVEREAYG